MANTVIGALRVVLQADTAAFETGLANAQKSLGNFSKGTKGFATAANLAIAGAATAIGASIKHMINEADNIGKAAQKFGVPVEQLSALKYAADLADVSFEALGKGLGKLSKSMVEGLANPLGDSAKNFAALGISIKDSAGNLKSTETVFTDIADKFSRMEDGAEKTALALRIFGRSGAELIPLLNAGRTGIKAMTDEARKLGIVISADTAAKAEQFNDTLKKVSVSFNAIGLRLAEQLLPALQKFADLMVKGSQQGSGFATFLASLVPSESDLQKLEWDYQLLQNIRAEAAGLKQFGKGFWDEMNKPLAEFSMTKHMEEYGRVLDENKKKFEELKRSWLSLGTAGAFDSIDNLGVQMETVSRGAAKVNTGLLAAKSAVQTFMESTKKSTDAQLVEAQTMNMAVGTRERMTIVWTAENIAKQNNIKLTDEQIVKIAALGAAAEQAALKVAGAKMAQEALTSLDVYRDKLLEINRILEKNPQLQAAAADAGRKANAALIQSYGEVAAQAAGGFADFFKTFGAGNKKMFAIGKAFAISQSIINTYMAATNALARTPLPPPFPQIAAAGIIAAGLAQVAKISAEKMPAFATGGAMTIGGAGGVDSQMVSFRGSPGETVRVDQNKYGEGGGGKTITVAGMNARDYYRGDVLRDLLANMQEAVNDGYKLKLA